MLLLFLVCVYQWLCVWVWQITEFQASSGLVDVCGEHTDTYFLGKTWCGSQGRARGFVVIYCTVNKRAVCCEESCILGPTSPPSPRSTIQTVTKNLYLYNNVIMYAITVVTHLKTKHPVYIPVVNILNLCLLLSETSWFTVISHLKGTETFCFNFSLMSSCSVWGPNVWRIKMLQGAGVNLWHQL